MLWYKSWRDTRWRFFVGLGVLMLSGVSVVLIYPRVLALVPLVPSSDVGGEVGRRIREIAELSRGAELLVLDEPTAGLDPAMTEEVLQALVGHAAREGMTIFFSSHQIAEVEQIADTVAIIDRGRTVVSGALDDLREHYRRIQFVFESDAPDATFRTPGAGRARRHGRVLTVLSSCGSDRVIDEARALNPLTVEILPVSLKEIFLETVVGED